MIIITRLVFSKGTLTYVQKVDTVQFDIYQRTQDDENYELLEPQLVLLASDQLSLLFRFTNYQITLNKVNFKEKFYWKKEELNTAIKTKNNEVILCKRNAPYLSDKKNRKEDTDVEEVFYLGGFHELKSKQETSKKLTMAQQIKEGIHFMEKGDFPVQIKRSIKKELDHDEFIETERRKANEGENMMNVKTPIIKMQKPKTQVDKILIVDESMNSEEVDFDQLVFKNNKKSTFRKLLEENCDESLRVQNPETRISESCLNSAGTEPDKLLTLSDSTYCPICYSDSIPRKVVIDSCKHMFCLDCLEEWIKQTNLCPLCKTRFNRISVFINEKFVEVKNVADKALVYEYLETSEDLLIQNADDFCYVCEKSDFENSLLICDSCLTKCCHIFCTKPKMRFIPEGDWFCDYCVRDKDLRSNYPVAGLFAPKSRRVR